MALKTLMLRKKINDKRSALEALRVKDADFNKREAELEASIEEAMTDEEKTVIETEVAAFDGEKTQHETNKADLEKEIGELEDELSEAEKDKNLTTPTEGRKEVIKMETREKFFGMNAERRDAFFARGDVKEFLQRVRDLGTQKRAVNGAELLIPTVVLDLIRENIEGYSKLYKHVNVKRVSGKARQTVMGTIPEAVWTEMCARLNELDLSFANVEVDGYKVGGFIAVCNAVLEDSDVALATEIVTALGQAIGYALDKAILYGTGTKMPVGIMTRLAQATDPNDASTSIPWKDLHTTNVLAITGKSDAALFKALVEATGAAKGKYSRGTKFWVMNEKTYTKLVSNQCGGRNRQRCERDHAHRRRCNRSAGLCSGRCDHRWLWRPVSACGASERYCRTV